MTARPHLDRFRLVAPLTGDLKVFSEEHRRLVRERIDPMPGEVAEPLSEVRQFLGRFVAFASPAQLIAVTLWVAHAWLLDCFDSSPRLALLSPEPGSGKTRTLEVIELLVPRPMHALNASAAPIFRSIESARPTLLFDEVDAIFTHRGKDESSEDLRAMMNAGHRVGATIPRCVGPRHDVVQFPVYAAVALAGLGDLPDTLMTRSVIVRMRRRAPGERVEPFRRRKVSGEGATLASRLARWSESIEGEVTGSWPEMPNGIEDRPADVWEPLLAIADAAGGEWPDIARAASSDLCKVAENRDASLGVKLLADLRAIWGDAEARSTVWILEALHKLEESPWADLRGKPLDPRGLSRRLKAYGVEGTKVMVTEGSLRGYRREDLFDAWERYLPAVDAEEESAEHAESVPDVPHIPDSQGRESVRARCIEGLD